MEFKPVFKKSTDDTQSQSDGINIFNLIDGLDGLATGIAGIAAMTMFILSVLAGRHDSAALAIAFVGAAIGFLFYNFNPASIFLGDSGSLLLGYVLGIFTGRCCGMIERCKIARSGNPQG